MSGKCLSNVMNGKELQRLRKFVEEHWGSFVLISESSHLVMTFSFEGKEYLLKQQRLQESHLSPFWKLMKWVFGSDFSVQRSQMPALTAFLKEHCPMSVPDFFFADEKKQIQVFEKCPGRGYEPDEFPKEVAFQLGEYVASLHQHEFAAGGTLQHHPYQDLKQRMDLAGERLIKEEWQDAKELRSFWERARRFEPSRKIFVPMMADISANQFLFSQSLDHLEAVVDLDAYVIGPPEWELSVLKGCVPDWEAFRRGYEQKRPFPELGKGERYYAFLMALCNPWNPSEIRRCLSEEIL